MAKEELLEFEGEVTEELPDGNFRVKLDNDHVILAYTAGKMRKFRIRTGVGDRVTVEMSPYDLARGRITFRHKSAQPTTAATGQRRAMWRKRGQFFTSADLVLVMAGLVPAVHVFFCIQNVDARHKAGHDVERPAQA